MGDKNTRPHPSAEPVDDLIERLRDAGFVLVSPGMRKLANDAADRIAALEADNARLMGLVKEAGEALSEYACHGGPDLPCIRSKDQCRTECGKIAGDALAKIKEATDA